jgi:hypothetical protein
VKPTHEHETTQRQLQEWFDFTPADLRINRTLRLSPDQVASLSFSARWGVVLGALTGLAAAVAIMLLAGTAGYALLAFLLIFGLIAWLARRRKRKRAALLSRGVAMARGTASVQPQPAKRRGEPTDHVVIDGKTFTVSEDAFAHGGVYEVYFIREMNNRIVSADQVG